MLPHGVHQADDPIVGLDHQQHLVLVRRAFGQAVVEALDVTGHGRLAEGRGEPVLRRLEQRERAGLVTRFQVPDPEPPTVQLTVHQHADESIPPAPPFPARGAKTMCDRAARVGSVSVVQVRRLRILLPVDVVRVRIPAAGSLSAVV